MAQDKGMPPWVWIGCGCLLCIGLLIGGIFALGALGVATLKNTVDDMADPVARTAKVADMLGIDELPAEFHAHVAFGIPFALDVAVISDGEPPPGVEGGSFEEKLENMDEGLFPDSQRLGRNTLVFIKARGIDDRYTIEEILNGENKGSGTHVNLDMQFDSAQTLGEGDLEVAGGTVAWRAERGQLTISGGTMNVEWAAIDCKGSDRRRSGVWFQDLDADGTSGAAVGRPGDPQALMEFLTPFGFCG